MSSVAYQGDEGVSERREDENPLDTHHERQQNTTAVGGHSDSTQPRTSGLFKKIRDLRDIHQMAKDLEEENARLKSLLQQVGTPTTKGGEAYRMLFKKTGYLNKYRPYATSSLWANTWEPRYVVVKFDSLMYYKNERDVYRNPPRGQLGLRGTFVEVEGLKRRKYWTFRVVDSFGADLVRLSTESHSEMNAWLEALAECGCGMRRSGSSSSMLSSMDDASAGIQPVVKDGDHGILARTQSGYTSDQSDVGRQPAFAEKKKHDKKKRGMGTGYDGCVPVHTHPKFSMLSSERIRFSDQSGMLTLMFIILAATNFRLILENMLKYGIRFNPFTFIQMVVTPSGNTPLILCWPALLVFATFGFLIEKFAAALLKKENFLRAGDEKKADDGTMVDRRRARRKRITEGMIGFLNIFNMTIVLLVPFHIITVTNAEPLPSFGLTMVTIVLWLKLVSFIHVNWSLRQLKRIDPRRRWPGESLSGSEPLAVETNDMVYPKNLSMNHFFYFLVAPTLCYQISYPRSPRFRFRWLLRKIAMLSAGLGMMLFITEQYIEPTIDNSIKPLQDMDWLVIIERILKLSIPTLYFWLAMFYSLFELWLNILAEITRFGDREFYKDWWNSATLGEYWRLWNMPVHKWMLRHVYFPATNMGISKFAAGFIVFFLSAVLHEVMVGVPLHMIRGWAFWGLMLQVPLVWVTEMLKRHFKSDRLGNAIFWVSFCFLGQPIAEILYYHDYRKSHYM